MKIFSKFKQLSKDIKLIIITALIVSCVGVYAAGVCVISATAGEVTYNNSTVQAAIDELYDISKNNCPDGYLCTRSLYKIMASNSVLDDRASTYVTSSSGIDFSQIASNTNGKGIYEIASTKNDLYPIYYYRGAVNNNNVKFGGFCWKAIRTTDTGGVKLIYNGSPDGSGNCTNTTGTATQIGTSAFNSNYNSPVYTGYMYGTVYSTSSKSASNLNTSYKYGKDVTYSGGTYTLTNIKTSIGTWATDYNTFNNNHYTCFTTGTTCTSVYYITETDTSNAWYITLTNGKKVGDAIDEMFNNVNANTTSSVAKTQVEDWYNNNLSSYSSFIEDTIYCSDRSIGGLSGWDPNGGDTEDYFYFNSRNRLRITFEPDLTCSRALDRFTVSFTIGNGNLTYPVGLITMDEIMYAGGVTGASDALDDTNTSYYLYTNQDYWSMTPGYFRYGNHAFNFNIKSTGNVYSNHSQYVYGLRPVISISSASVVESGDGTSTNPYVIETS